MQLAPAPLPRFASPSARRPARPYLLAGRFSLAAVLVLLAVRVLAPGVLDRTAPAVLVAGLLAGLPHGAVDHLVPDWAGVPLDRIRRLVLLVAYLGAAVAAFALLRMFPLVALTVFVAVSALHFGAGEARFSAERAGRPASREALDVVAHGGVTALLPLVLWPQQVAPLLVALVPGSTGVLPGPVRQVTVAAVLVTAAASVVRSLARGRRLEATELAALVAVFVLVPPLAAFGVYFGAWHSLRHLARMVRLDPGNAPDLERGDLLTPVVRLSRAAVAPTLAALGLLGLLWFTAGGWGTFAAVDVALLAGLTVPHVSTVGWLDRRARLSGTGR